MKFSALVLTVAAAAAAVHAQSSTDSSAAPTSTSGLTPCILTCLQQSASANGCPNFTDVSCLCSNTQFQSAARSCRGSPVEDSFAHLESSGLLESATGDL
ncbi:hypothetical protein K466DRAFT_668591 [Polyporus arcularius HHB13444]|uniref:CFEM domain-containing protein n=1 Tax=Polyporus arcularius HHB13444 TaxID=1314778 RepID=A0A5C3NLL6_9APHY|nr:hypothetical protein K466DRAFT_668591 [Polyporus arcularius HHB13444]